MTTADPPPSLDTALETLPVIGIVRGCPPEHLDAVASAAAEAGLRAIEVTLDSPDPFDGITRLGAALPNVVVGAGTVLTSRDVEAAREAGARFLVSPITSHDVLGAAVRHDLPCLPGAATPTEIVTALAAGAHAVKIFPARELGGPDFVSSVLEPLGRPRLVPTGGVDAGDAPAYLTSGAWAVGLGGSIFSRSALAAGDADSVGRAMEQVVAALS